MNSAEVSTPPDGTEFVIPYAWDVGEAVREAVGAAHASQNSRNAEDGASSPSDRPEIELRWLAAIVQERRESEWLLHRVLEKRVLAVMAGVRGSFKSFIALDWMMRIALAGHPVVILSGEGGGLDRRVDAWMRVHAPTTDLTTVRVFALERPIDLTSDAVMLQLREAVDNGVPRPAAILVDTYSKFAPGLDENDNAEVAEFLFRLSRNLRDAYGCTVLLVCHAGHGDSKRPRGASALMANPDAEYIVERPDPTGMLCTVSRERFKDSASLPPLAYMARSVDLGRADSYGDRVTSLVLEPADAPPEKPKGQWGKNQTAILVALREWARSNPGAAHISTPDITGICRAQGISRKRQPEVLNSLVNARILTASVAGYTFDRDAL